MPPHKRDLRVSSAAERMEMIRLAIDGFEGFTLSDVELQRSGPSYTVDTVVDLKNNQPENTELFLMIGLDAFLEIDTWKEYRKLLQEIPFIVMIRPDTGPDRVTEPTRRVAQYLHQHISSDYTASLSPKCFTHDHLQTVFTCEITLMDISSSCIRKLIRQNRSVRYLVPRSVQAYIREKGLYT